MDTTAYLPDLKGVEVGSPAMEDLRYALDLLERHMEEDLEPEDDEGNDSGEWLACGSAIATLRWLTKEA